MITQEVLEAIKKDIPVEYKMPHCKDWFLLDENAKAGLNIYSYMDLEFRIKPIKKNKNHLEWIYDRLIYTHQENYCYDYMIKFKYIIDNMKD